MLTILPDTERLARLLADRIGKSPEDVIRLALEASARSAGLSTGEIDSADRRAMIEAARTIASRSSRRPLLDARSENEILGYDEHGIPR